MFRLSQCAIAILVMSRSVTAQTMPTSVQAAEADGASYSRANAPVYTPTAFTSAFTGTAERKCTVQSNSDATSGQLRSGEMILRSRLVGPWGLKADRDHKIYWQPLHNPFEFRDTLLIRAVRIDSPTDSLRLSISGWGYSPGRKKESGFPSLLRFPTAGNWLVVVSAGSDWGCFVLPVSAT